MKRFLWISLIIVVMVFFWLYMDGADMTDTTDIVSAILLSAVSVCGFGAHDCYVDPKFFRELEDNYVEGTLSKDDWEFMCQQIKQKKNRMKMFLGTGAIVLTVGYYLYTRNGTDSILFFVFLFCATGAIFMSVTQQDYMILFRKRMKGIIQSDFHLAHEVERLEFKKGFKHFLTAGAVILGWILFLSRVY